MVIIENFGDHAHASFCLFIMEEATAPCPVCNKLVPLEAINNHIDICLLPGGRELHAELPSPKNAESTRTASRTRHLSQTHVTNPLSPSQPQPVQSMLRKRSSPSPGSSKQSLLSFGQTEPHLTGTTTTNPPPAKARKLIWTPVPVVTKQSSGDDCEESVAGRDTEHKVSNELSAPLAEVMRPSSIADFVGQENVIGKNAILRTILESGNVPSLIFWGPPGCGKVCCLCQLKG